MGNVPLEMCIGTGHKFRRLADEASDSSLLVLAKHLDLPMEDAETVDFVRFALRNAYAEISLAMHAVRVDTVKRYANSEIKP